MSMIEGHHRVCGGVSKVSGKACRAFCKRGHDRCFRHLEGAEGAEVRECSICMDDLGKVRSQVVGLNCGHEFCKRCIRRWLENSKDTCPNCRGLIGMAKITEVFVHVPWSFETGRDMPVFADRTIWLWFTDMVCRYVADDLGHRYREEDILSYVRTVIPMIGDAAR
jgi:hypothetical protein